jgi:hypothetical protein
MLARFVNVKGDTNFGLCLEQDPASGMHLIFWDDFAQLRTRLKTPPRHYYEKTDEKSLRPHIGWVRPAQADAKFGTRLEMLTPQRKFSIPILQELAKAALAGRLTEVWEARRAELMGEYAKSFNEGAP